MRRQREPSLLRRSPVWWGVFVLHLALGTFFMARARVRRGSFWQAVFFAALVLGAYLSVRTGTG